MTYPLFPRILSRFGSGSDERIRRNPSEEKSWEKTLIGISTDPEKPLLPVLPGLLQKKASFPGNNYTCHLPKGIPEKDLPDLSFPTRAFPHEIPKS
jgi:hypothetical protein